jgi:signal transduction histidine kinase
MKAKDLKIGSVLEFEESQGIITFKGNRFLLIDAEAMGLMRREIINMLGTDIARRLLTRYGFACGHSDALRLNRDYNWDSEEEWMMAGPMMHMLEGIVHVRPSHLEYSRKTDTFLMQGEWVNSYEAQQHIKYLGCSDQPTCWTLTGYASGYATAFFGQQLICSEQSCVGKGDPVCKWQIGRPRQMGLEAQQALQDLQGYDVPGTINMLEEQIAARTLELSALNAASIILAESLSLDELLCKVLPHILKATGASFGRILLLNESGEKLELRVQTEPDRIGEELEPTQLYVALPVSEKKSWERLRGGNLVTTHEPLNTLLLPELSWRHNWQSLVSVPLLTRGEISGVLELASPNRNWPGTPEERRLLLSLGRQIGMAIGNAQLYEQEQQRAKAWQGLVEIGHKVASSQDRQQVFDSLVEYACELLDTEVAFVGILSEDETCLEMTGSSGTRNARLRNLRLPASQGLVQMLIQGGKPIIVPYCRTDPRLKDQPTPELISEGIISLLAVPLTARGKVLGALYVGERRQRLYTDSDADLLTALATQAAITVENARLHEREIARIKEVERIKADFLAMVTHELRTPLTNIKGIASGLLQPDIEWDKASEHSFLSAINEEADVLTALVSDLLDMSRLEAGAWTIYLEDCTFDEIISEVQRKLVGWLEGRELIWEIAPALPQLRLDPTQIARVLLNLITNALKYGGTGPVYVRAQVLDNAWIEVEVCDNGPGISPEEREHIFDKFYRSPMAEPGLRDKPGTGLGLAIVKGIVEAHGGKIWLEDSSINCGATFCFTLPVANRDS